MRVLMTGDAVGGVWTYALALTEALRVRGVEVALATMGPRPSAQQRADAFGAGAIELHESEFRLEWMPDPWEDVGTAGDWLLSLAAQVNADLVHLNGFAHAGLPWEVPVVVGAHSCVLSWWRAVRRVAAPIEWDEYRRRVRAGLDAAGATAFPTTALLNAMEAEYGSIAGARVIHNGLRGVTIRCPIKEPFVLATGRFRDEGKNLALLQDVGARLRWPLYVAGECDIAGERVHPCGVVSLGRLERDELYGWQQRAAIAVHPARYEPFGFGPLEAARAHCALVLADIPSLRELWEGAALFADPDDASGFAAAVERLIAQPGTLAVMRARAAHRARAYTAEGMAANYAALYQGLTAVRAGPRRIACGS